MPTCQQPVIALWFFTLGCLSGFAQISASSPAKDTEIGNPCCLALDNAGHLYFDQIGGAVRRLDLRTNTISNVSGTGKRYKEGVNASEVSLTFPSELTVDTEGNLFVVEGDYIRRIDSQTGLISTVAGTGKFADTIDGAPALSASFLRMAALAVSPEGEMFIADDLQQKVFRVDGKDGRVHRVAGTGKKGFSGDGGPALDASFLFIESIVMDKAGNLIIADSDNCRIRRVDHLSGVINTIAVTGGLEQGCPPPRGSNPAIPSPYDLALSSDGDVYFVEPAMNVVERLDGKSGALSTVAGTGANGFTGDGGLAADAELSSPSGLAIDSNGNLFVADWGNNWIRRVDASTKVITTVAGNGRSNCCFVHIEE
jgi:streptogramin lyase